MSDNGSKFTSKEFKDFFESYPIDHVTTAPFHPRFNGQVERFVDTLKRVSKKVRATPTEKALQQFLQEYRITPNNKIRFVYDKMLPKQTKPGRTNIVPTKRYNPGEKVFLKTIDLSGRRVRSREELGI